MGRPFLFTLDYDSGLGTLIQQSFSREGNRGWALVVSVAVIKRMFIKSSMGGTVGAMNKADVCGLHTLGSGV